MTPNVMKVTTLKRPGNNMTGGVHVDCVMSCYREIGERGAIFRLRYTIADTFLRPRTIDLYKKRKRNDFAKTPKNLGILVI